MGGPGARVSEQKHTCKNRVSVHPLHFSLLDKLTKMWGQRSRPIPTNNLGRKDSVHGEVGQEDSEVIN